MRGADGHSSGSLRDAIKVIKVRDMAQQQLQVFDSPGVGPGIFSRHGDSNGDATPAPAQISMNTGIVEQPGVVEAPVPMTMGDPNFQWLDRYVYAARLKFPCSAGKKLELEAMLHSTVPPLALSSRGMTEAEWAECCAALRAIVEAQFFKSSPAAEFIYYCVPGGPLQTCLCLLNPITCVVCIGPVDRARTACKLKCTAILFKYGYKVC